MTLTELFEAEMINRLGFKHTMRNGKQLLKMKINNIKTVLL